MAMLSSLPEELLLYIVSFLDAEPPSLTKFCHEPSFQLTDSDSKSLKNLSCTSRMWRRILAPILFQYVRISLSYEPRYVAESRGLLDHLQNNFEHLNPRERRIFLRLKQEADGFLFNELEAFSSDHINLAPENGGVAPTKMYLAVHEDDLVLRDAPMLIYCHHLPKDVQHLFSLLSSHRIHSNRSLVISTEHDTNGQVRRMLEDFFHLGARTIWKVILANMDPQRLIIAAPPATLALLASLPEDNGDSWAFEMKVHYLELRQSPSPQSVHTDSCRRRERLESSSVVRDRPWTHVGYNEGSSVPAYSTYEYSWKQSPRIIPRILQQMQNTNAKCCSLRTFSYTAVFPLASNHRALVGIMRNLSSLRAVHYQLTPGNENDVLDNKDRLRRAQHSDLWMECDRCYEDIIFQGRLPQHCKFSTSDHSMTEGLADKFRTLAEIDDNSQWTRVDDYSWTRD
jgi:hypothetical protein